MSDPTPTVTPTTAANLAAASGLVRTLLTSGAALVAVLHFTHAAAALQALATRAGDIVDGTVAAAGLAALVYGAVSRWRVEHKAASK